MPAMLGLSDLPGSVQIGLQLVLIVVAGLVGFLVLRTAVGVAMKHLLERRAVEAPPSAVSRAELEQRVRTIGRLIVRIGGTVLAIIAVLMALDLFGIDIGPAVAGLGIAGIAIGFGAQTLIRDWLSGMFIILENQYNAGDVVRIAGVEGTVEELGLRRTTLRDLDGTVHTVPNGQVLVASNMTRTWARVNLDVNVAYGTDIERASQLIDTVGEELQADAEWGPRLLEAPTVTRIDALADASVKLKVLGRVRPGEQWAVSGELRKRILLAFTREGIIGGKVEAPEAPPAE
jgi:moderate conductance mechanosensitive channel